MQHETKLCSSNPDNITPLLADISSKPRTRSNRSIVFIIEHAHDGATGFQALNSRLREKMLVLSIRYDAKYM